MTDPELLRLREHPDLADAAATWFHEKWGVPVEAYRESIAECLTGGGPVPQWYILRAGTRIVGGLGVIENDFHERKDLRPNVCAVFVEPEWRNRGLAGRLLAEVCRDMAALGVDTLYLLTDHIGFYERYGWEYLCPSLGDGADTPSRLYIHRPDAAR